ncbi:6-bladed beta-propeller [Bacteroides sp. CG01]|uniref:6-bladed beta-propeller n=1 Tax=Bacteroides sp. CG01 TaxID=3096000 RepID=UPI002AFF37CD|nr:6-bladed beta-propeller [Bacteroides sp. CG01]
MFFLSIIFLVGCGKKIKYSNESNLTVLQIDWDNIVDRFDYSSMVEDSILMIPLEVRDDCIIGEVTKLLYQNNLIYIADNISKSIFVFDLSGKLVTKVHSLGNGPGEYTNITSFTVHNTDIIIFDHTINRLFFYNVSGEFVRDKDVSAIWGSDMFELDNKLYLVNDGGYSKNGYYHLFSIDLEDADKYEMYLPFEKRQNNQGWIVDSYHAKLKNEAIIYFWPYDIIYTVTNREIYPSFRIDFGKKDIPKEVLYRDGRKALQTTINENYVTLARVHQSQSYLFLLHGDSHNDYTTIYDKKRGSMQTVKRMVNNKLGGLFLQASNDSYVVQDEKIIQCYPADYIEYFSEEYLDSADFYSEDLRQRFKDWSHWKVEEKNPIVFIQKLK